MGHSGQSMAILGHDFNIAKSSSWDAKNHAFSSLSRNLTFEHSELLSNLYEKLANCGLETYAFIGPVKNGKHIFAEVPVYCDNRSCSNPDCKKHRLYKYKREHEPQLEYLKDNIDVPKAYVFTGWNIPIYEWDVDFTKKFVRKRLARLYLLLKKLSHTVFSIHMELKLYPVGHPKYGMAYLHFHVVSGFIDVGKARQYWKRVVKYEHALSMDAIEGYISKYASKTPIFGCDNDRSMYHLIVYKTQMHRYSVGLQDCKKYEKNHEQLWFREDLIVMEAMACLKTRVERDNGYSKVLDDYMHRIYSDDKPPPKMWEDLIAQ